MFTVPIGFFKGVSIPAEVITNFSLNSAAPNGTNQEFDMGDQTEFDITGDLTLSIMAKLDALDNTEQPVFTKYDFVDDRSYSLHIHDGTNSLRFTVSSDGENTGADSAIWTGVTTGVWYHVVCIHDGTNIKLYVDGDLKDTVAHAGGIHSGIAPLQVGRRANEFGNIEVSHADIYNADMTANISDFTTAGGDIICRADRNAALNAASNVGSWELSNFDGNTGGELTDLSLSGNNATNNGPITFTGSGSNVECT